MPREVTLAPWQSLHVRWKRRIPEKTCFAEDGEVPFLYPLQ